MMMMMITCVHIACVQQLIACRAFSASVKLVVLGACVLQHPGDDGRQDGAAVFQRSRVRHQRGAGVSGQQQQQQQQQRTCRHSSHRDQVAHTHLD